MFILSQDLTLERKDTRFDSWKEGQRKNKSPFILTEGTWVNSDLFLIIPESCYQHHLISLLSTLLQQLLWFWVTPYPSNKSFFIFQVFQSWTWLLHLKIPDWCTRACTLPQSIIFLKDNAEFNTLYQYIDMKYFCSLSWICVYMYTCLCICMLVYKTHMQIPGLHQHLNEDFTFLK